MVKQLNEDYGTGLYMEPERFRTPVYFSMACNDERILKTLERMGAIIKYTTERTVYFYLDGIHLTLGHNWDDNRHVVAQSTGLGLRIGEQVESDVKKAIEGIQVKEGSNLYIVK